MFRIAHASIDENGRASGGMAGDQTGYEVCVRSWYSSPWDVVLRPKSIVIADKMAIFAQVVCESNKVGYDQGNRNSLHDECLRVNYNPYILPPCETDCSEFMTVCAEAAGIDMFSSYMYMGNGKYNAPVTSTMVKGFTGTGYFTALYDKKYTSSFNYLRRGDILVRTSGHTAMALDTGLYEEENMITADQLVEIINSDTSGKVISALVNKMTPAQASTLVTKYRETLRTNYSSEYSEEAREWAVDNKIIRGDAEGNCMWKDFITREDSAVILYRAHQLEN